MVEHECLILIPRHCLHNIMLHSSMHQGLNYLRVNLLDKQIEIDNSSSKNQVLIKLHYCNNLPL